jgi:hypothetical protein
VIKLKPARTCFKKGCTNKPTFGVNGIWSCNHHAHEAMETAMTDTDKKYLKGGEKN